MCGGVAGTLPHMSDPQDEGTARSNVRMLAIGLAVGVLVFVITGGHFFFLPLLLIPFGLFRFGGPRHKRDDLRLRSPLQPVKRARPRHRRRR